MPDDLTTLSGHTEGPWNVSRTLLPPYAVDGVWSDKGDHIASFVLMTELDKRVKEDNARLIAAAPALLAIATELHDGLHKLGWGGAADWAFTRRGIAPPASADAVGRDGE